MDNSKYEAVQAKIAEACPELEQYETVPCPDGMVGCCVHHQRKVYTPARLSHVLRAIEIEEAYIFTVAHNGWMCISENDSLDGSNGVQYDLTKDDLSLQSPETIDFLFKILCE